MRTEERQRRDRGGPVQHRDVRIATRFSGGKGGVNSLRQKRGGTFLRDHSIPREDDRDRGRETRFSPTLIKMFDLSDAVIHNKIKHGFISLSVALLLFDP